MKIVAADFVTSAARAADLPPGRVPEIALIGRSNVGKSSLINALVGRQVARTSAAPGKTRLLNVYRVRPAPHPQLPGDLYLMDLPGYGYARGGEPAARAFARLTDAYFSRAARQPTRIAGVLLVVDARHPGRPADRAARAWLAGQAWRVIAVATKVDTLGQAARMQHMRQLETILQVPVAPVSARTGEGMNALWTHIIDLIRPRPTA